MIINRIPLPEILNLSGKKPWQIRHVDTMDLWKFGDYKHYSSLDLLTSVLGVPSPKTDLTGGDVSKVYYEKQDLKRIVQYCERDAISVLRVYLRLKGITMEFENIDFIEFTG
jgi:predicted PolB exonuclease-like 3'-5' exonuclease